MSGCTDTRAFTITERELKYELASLRTFAKRGGHYRKSTGWAIRINKETGRLSLVLYYEHKDGYQAQAQAGLA